MREKRIEVIAVIPRVLIEEVRFPLIFYRGAAELRGWLRWCVHWSVHDGFFLCCQALNNSGLIRLSFLKSGRNENFAPRRE